MKNRVLKSVRVITLSVAAVVMVVVGSLSAGVGANASKTMEETDVVKYVEYSEDITSYLDNNKAPEYTGADAGFGYLFGGWYDKNGDTYTAIKDITDLENKTGTVVAKFVPAQTLSVKCQNWAGTKEGAEDVIVRAISAVDSTNYSGYGFKIDYVNVPVNLNILSKNNKAAAGILSVKSDDNLKFVGAEKGVECGKVFDEMEFNVLSDGTIKCVGNTSDISEKEEMDIYINLKFQRKDTDSEAPIANEFYTFTVGGEEFCDKNEKLLENDDVWNIIY